MHGRLLRITLLLLIIGFVVAMGVVWFRRKRAQTNSQPQHQNTQSMDFARHLNQDSVQEITEEAELSRLMAQSQKPLAIKFHATWCSVCESMKPIDAQIAEQFAGKVIIAQADVDNKKFGSILEQHSIAAVPTYFFMREGKVVERVNGAMSLEEYAAQITAIIN